MPPAPCSTNDLPRPLRPFAARFGIRGGISALALTTIAALLPGATPAVAQDEANVFGHHERKGATLIGIFYDLKQTQQREPIPDSSKRYVSEIDAFLTSGFDEALFNRFFRAALPLYTTQFSIPRMNADGAPKAFGVEGLVKPKYWVIHYKGQIAPPVDGTYRFVGNFDDLLIVAINRKVVLDGSRPDTRMARLAWKEPADKGPTVAANTLAKYGDWMELKADQPVDIDILIGERPGGYFHGVLLYEKKGETYPKNAKKQAILPLFQLAPKPTPNATFTTDHPAWKCFE